MPLPTAPRRGQWKGLALAGVALAGLMAGEAQAKWIKATVTGTVLTSATGYTLQASNPITLNFYIQNYSGASGTPNYWEQTTALPNYTQLFNYATGTGSTGISGNYNASLPPTNDSSTIQSANNGSGFLLRAAATPSTGLTINGPNDPIAYISLGGNLNDFLSTFPGTSDVVDFLSAATHPSLGGTPGLFTCTSCAGIIQSTTAEKAITFTWTNIQFDQIEPVPAPLPVVGALAAFSFSRKLRTRLASR
jgi:hypothetical protein